MFGRPRCREWTPLTTQQLRLRSLIQVKLILLSFINNSLYKKMLRKNLLTNAYTQVSYVIFKFIFCVKRFLGNF